MDNSMQIDALLIERDFTWFCQRPRTEGKFGNVDLNGSSNAHTI